LDAFDVKFKVNSLDELSFAFLISDSFEYLDADLIDDVFRNDAGRFPDVVHEKFHALVCFIFFETCGMVEKRVCNRRLIYFLYFKIG
jgi:hypothetical protein